MRSVKRFTEDSLLSASSPTLAKDRRDILSVLPSGAERRAKLHIHDMVVRHPKFAAKAFGINYTPPSLSYVGSGSTARVFRRNSDEVLKTLDYTMRLGVQERQETLGRIQDGHAALTDSMKPFVLPQEAFIARHPIMRDYHAVQITQPYKNITDPELFSSSGNPWHIKSSVEALRETHPVAADQLPDFAASSRALLGATGLLPDLLGEANVVVEESGQLLLIDGEPISDSFYAFEQRERILANLDGLEAALTA